jgi:hypothetical protein
MSFASFTMMNETGHEGEWNAQLDSPAGAARDTGTPTDEPPPVPLLPYRPSARRATVAIWLLAVSTVVAAVATATEIYGVALIGKEAAGALTDQDAGRFMAIGTAISVARLVTFIGTAIAFLAWLSRAVENVPRLGAGTPSASPRWAIAWWFIPFANFGMPYDIVRELRGRLRGDSRRVHPPHLLAWWFAFLAGDVLAEVAAGLPFETIRQTTATLTIATVGSALTAAAGVLAIIVVRDIERAAATRAASMPSDALEDPAVRVADWDEAPRRSGWRMRPSWVGFVAIPAAAAVFVAVPLLVEGLGATLKHEAAPLEAGLPDRVQEQVLERSSLRGEDYFVSFVGLNSAALAQTKADLAASGLTVDDVALAAALPADAEGPTNAVFAFQVRGVAAATLPDSVLIDHPDAGSFTAVVIAGKSVRRGTAGMIDAGGLVQGIPYLYDLGTIRFIVVTNDEDWAADAVAQLPG